MIDIEQLRADIAAGTPGPWPMETVRTSCGVCHKIGPWPHKWRHGADMSACIYDDYPSPPKGTDTMLGNARRIARVPDLEAAYLALADENARLRAALAEISDRHIPDQPAAFGGDELQWAQRQHGQLRALARAALGETK